MKIKPEYYNTAIAFGSSGVALKYRTTLELVELGILARSSGDTTLLRLFESLPDMRDLKLLKIKLLETRLKMNLHAGKEENIEST